MATPFLGNMTEVFTIFNEYTVDGIAKAKKVDQFMTDNFKELMEHPTHPDEVEKLVSKVDQVKGNGVDSTIFAGLLCNLLHAYSKGHIGVAKNPETSEAPASS